MILPTGKSAGAGNAMESIFAALPCPIWHGCFGDPRYNKCSAIAQTLSILSFEHGLLLWVGLSYLWLSEILHESIGRSFGFNSSARVATLTCIFGTPRRPLLLARHSNRWEKCHPTDHEPEIAHRVAGQRKEHDPPHRASQSLNNGRAAG